MPIPEFQTLMLLLMEALSDGQERLIREVAASLADRFGLTEEERQESAAATVVGPLFESDDICANV